MIYDVVVAGGGMVGTGLAALLGRAGMRVALVEASPAVSLPRGEIFDPRVSALTRASQRVLEAAGAWHEPCNQRAQPYRRMVVWDQASSGRVEFDCADIGEPDLGHIAENRLIQYGLEQALQASDAVQWFRERRVVGLQVESTEVKVQLDDGQLLRARLLVGADGGRSRVRQMAGLPVRESAYGQTAVVASVRAAGGHRQSAWQRFLETGPLAFLPLPGDHGSIVWSTSPGQAKQLASMSVAEFEAALSASLQGSLGEIHCLSERLTFPLVSRQAGSYVKSRVALVGDAAHTIHPLAGQGVNLGLLDAASLAQVLAEADADPGHIQALRRYERWRKGQNQLMDWSMGGFKQLFGSKLAPVRRLRGMGMSLFNRAGPLKYQVIRQAMGLQGDLPMVARDGVDPLR